MRTKIVGLLVVGFLATPVFAEMVYQEGPLEHKYLTLMEDGSAIETGPSPQEGSPTWYDSYTDAPGGGGFLAFPAATGPAGFDDYDSIPLPGTADMIDLEVFNFVGGVVDDGGIATFEFYDATASFVTDFSVMFPSGGNAFYTITITGDIVVPEDGIVQMVVDAGTTGQFFLSDNTPPLVGSNDLDFGATEDGVLLHNFALSGTAVPEPASIIFVLVGLLGFSCIRK